MHERPRRRSTSTVQHHTRPYRTLSWFPSDAFAPANASCRVGCAARPGDGCAAARDDGGPRALASTDAQAASGRSTSSATGYVHWLPRRSRRTSMNSRRFKSSQCLYWLRRSCVECCLRLCIALAASYGRRVESDMLLFPGGNERKSWRRSAGPICGFNDAFDAANAASLVNQAKPSRETSSHCCPGGSVCSRQSPAGGNLLDMGPAMSGRARRRFVLKECYRACCTIRQE